MNDSIALSRKKQKSFNKLVEKTKSKIKHGDIKVDETPVKRPGNRKSHYGVVYVSNIPHGFYEKELKGYFGQFGVVLKVRVARSSKTGGSKGHAFVKFKDEEVAKIAAETMDNYLMGKRLIKAKLLPHDAKSKGLFKKPNFSKEHFPTKVNRLRYKKTFNAQISDEVHVKKTKIAIKQIKKVTDKLKKAGIEYDFAPVDVPKELIPSNEKNIDDSSSEDIVFTSPEDMNKKNKHQKKSSKRTVKEVKDESNTKRVKKSAKISITDIVASNKRNKKYITDTEIKTNVGKKNTVKKAKTVSKENCNNKTESTDNNINENKENSKKNLDKKAEKEKTKKQNKANKRDVNKIVGVSKKSTKVLKLSGKKSTLIKELIQSNNQVEIVKNLDRKKSKSKVNRS